MSVPIGSLCLKIITRVLDNVTIVSITAVRVTITHEMANTKAVLQAILVQILTVVLKLVFCQIQIQYIGLLIGAQFPNFPNRAGPSGLGL